VIGDPALSVARDDLIGELARLQRLVGDAPHPAVVGGPP
jgi:hypothetical protein